jgi:hypothetical protein
VKTPPLLFVGIILVVFLVFLVGLATGLIGEVF